MRELLGSLLAQARSLWEQVAKLARANPKIAAIGAAVAVIGGIVLYGSTIMVNGLLAGVLVSGAAGILIYKMRVSQNPWLVRSYNGVIRHPLVSDVVFSLIAFWLSPAGITGWVAASVAALLASCWLLGAKEVEIPGKLALPKTVSVFNTVCGLDWEEAA